MPLKYSPLSDTHNCKWFIYPSFECIHIMFWGNGIHFPINGRAQSISWSIYSSWQVFFVIYKKRGEKAGKIGSMGQNIDLFFFQKSSHNLRFMCRCFVMKKSNVASSRLWSSFRNVLTFFQQIIFIYISPDDRPFGIATYTTGPSLLQQTA